LKEFWLLFLEKKIVRFIKGYEIKKAYLNYKKYCQEEVTKCSATRNLDYDLGVLLINFQQLKRDSL
jgi:hypothetical protein